MKDPLTQVKKTLLMGPGPSCVSDEVYRALALPTIGHLDPAFVKIMDGVKELMQNLMKTGNQLTIPISGS